MNKNQFVLSDRPGLRFAWRAAPLILALALILSACSAYQPAAQAAAQPGSSFVPATGANPTAAGVAMTATPGSTAAPTAAPAATSVVTAVPEAAQMGEGREAPKLYAGLFKDNAIAVLDTATNQIIKTIPVPPGPHGLAISADGRWVFASSDGDSKVSVIDATTDAVARSIEVGKAPHGLALTPDGRLLLAAVFGANQVAFINTASGQVAGQAAVPSPHNIAISPDGKTAYVAAQKQGASGLAVIDIAAKAQSSFIPLDKAPRALSFSPDGRQLYFTQAGVDAVQVLDPASNQVIKQIEVGASPHHPLFTPDGKLALVVSQGTGELYFIEPGKDEVFLSLKVGAMPHWIAVNPESTTAWVSNEGDNTISVVDLNHFTVTATILAGNAPRKLVVQPAIPVVQEATPAASTPAARGVDIQGMGFSPRAITVKAGTTITWTNHDSIAHTVTDDQGRFDSGPLAPGQSFSLTLSNPGDYAYHCSVHPFMTAQITVTP